MGATGKEGNCQIVQVALERPADGERRSQVMLRRAFRLWLVVEGIEQSTGKHQITYQLVRHPDIALRSYATFDCKARVNRAGDSRIEFGMVVAKSTELASKQTLESLGRRVGGKIFLVRSYQSAEDPHIDSVRPDERPTNEAD